MPASCPLAAAAPSRLVTSNAEVLLPVLRPMPSSTTRKPQPSLNHNLKSVPWVLTGDNGLEAVEAAIREALDAGAASDEVILNILARYREPASERPLDVVIDLKLSHPPIADCARHDTVRGLDAAA